MLVSAGFAVAAGINRRQIISFAGVATLPRDLIDDPSEPAREHYTTDPKTPSVNVNTEPKGTRNGRADE